MRHSISWATACVALSIGLPAPAWAQGPPASQARPQPAVGTQPSQGLPVVRERIEVVATRLPESPDEVPAAIEVITGDELRDLGARDLPGALALATGIDVAPGGDGGPASAVPGFWGLREADAYLLVVDGVPWGGAFNPALATLSLDDVERVEVLRGPAPVTYGATSFVGVIHVVHKQAAAGGGTVSVHGGSFSSGGGMLALKLPVASGWDSRLSVDADRQGFADPRTAFRRGHAQWRNATAWGAGRFWFNVDATWLDQDPASPRPREGATLSMLVPVDTNQNPGGAFLNDHRAAFSAGFDRQTARGVWTTSGSFSRASQDILRGYLLTLTDEPGNARGLRETIGLTDVYVDSHVSWKLPGRVTFVAGGDFLHGEGIAHGADFDYQAALDGASVSSARVPATLDVRIEDRREFGGAYALSEWEPVRSVRIDAGIRLNFTAETREAGNASEQPPAGDEGNTQHNVRPGGNLGVMWTAWQRSANRLALYADYRNTFKPAAFDFGIGEGEGEAEGLLKPETSQSVEVGLKARAFRGRVAAEASSFLMDFSNLVIARTINGLPALTNAGTQRFKGLETSVAWYLANHVTGRATYSFHVARFRDYVAEFDGVPTQLAGKSLEMSPRHLASVGVLYAPPSGVTAGLQIGYVGTRYLTKRNTALAGGFATLGASVGYRTSRWEVRLDGRNLTDRRDPVAESELGDSQYYQYPARRAGAALTVHF